MKPSEQAEELARRARELAACKQRIRVYGQVNAYGKSAAEELRSGALWVMAESALKEAQESYDAFLQTMPVDERAAAMQAAGKLLSETVR